MDIENKVKDFEKDLGELCKKHKLQIGGSVQFPMYKILPIEVQLALKVLENHGAQYICSVREAK